MTLESLKVKKAAHIWMSSVFLKSPLPPKKTVSTNRKRCENVRKCCANVRKFTHVSCMTLESLEGKKEAHLDEFTVSYAASA